MTKAEWIARCAARYQERAGLTAEQAKNAASEGTSESPCSPASEGYPEGWWHCTIHLNPETGEMHSDGDHRVRTWIQDKLANARPHAEAVADSVRADVGEQP